MASDGMWASCNREVGSCWGIEGDFDPVVAACEVVLLTQCGTGEGRVGRLSTVRARKVGGVVGGVSIVVFEDDAVRYPLVEINSSPLLLVSESIQQHLCGVCCSPSSAAYCHALLLCRCHCVGVYLPQASPAFILRVPPIFPLPISSLQTPKDGVLGRKILSTNPVFLLLCWLGGLATAAAGASSAHTRRSNAPKRPTVDGCTAKGCSLLDAVGSRRAITVEHSPGKFAAVNYGTFGIWDSMDLYTAPLRRCILLHDVDGLWMSLSQGRRGELLLLEQKVEAPDPDVALQVFTEKWSVRRLH